MSTPVPTTPRETAPVLPNLAALHAALFAALALADGLDPEQLEPDDYGPQIAALTPIVLARRAARDAAIRTAAINEAAGIARSHLHSQHTTGACAACAMADVIADELGRLAAAAAPTTTPTPEELNP